MKITIFKSWGQQKPPALRDRSEEIKQFREALTAAIAQYRKRGATRIARPSLPNQAAAQLYNESREELV